jgi:hypothetical protein
LGTNLTHNDIPIGEIVSAEFKGEYVECVVQLNEKGKDILNDNPKLYSFSHEFINNMEEIK